MTAIRMERDGGVGIITIDPFVSRSCARMARPD